MVQSEEYDLQNDGSRLLDDSEWWGYFVDLEDNNINKKIQIPKYCSTFKRYTPFLKRIEEKIEEEEEEEKADHEKKQEYSRAYILFGFTTLIVSCTVIILL